MKTSGSINNLTIIEKRRALFLHFLRASIDSMEEGLK